ncbi:hypothetical protein D3C78_1971510 [compost metagenome]
MAGEGVSQHMRVQVLSQLALAGGLDPSLDRPSANTPAFLTDEHRIVYRVGQFAQRQP